MCIYIYGMHTELPNYWQMSHSSQIWPQNSTSRNHWSCCWTYKQINTYEYNTIRVYNTISLTRTYWIADRDSLWQPTNVFKNKPRIVHVVTICYRNGLGHCMEQSKGEHSHLIKHNDPIMSKSLSPIGSCFHHSNKLIVADLTILHRSVSSINMTI